MEQLAETGSLEELDVPGWVKDIFRVSRDISPEWHVRMQAAFQTHTDNSVSKTINFPYDATTGDVSQAYMLAYETGCKGITVYRDGSKSEQVLSTGDTAKHGSDAPVEEAPTYRATRARPREIHGVTERVRTGHGNMYITVNFDDQQQPFELFSTLGKAGGCDSAQLEAISRLVSLALRSGIDAQNIVDHLRGITCCPAWDEGTLVRSAPDAVALALERHLRLHARADRRFHRPRTRGNPTAVYDRGGGVEGRRLPVVPPLPRLQRPGRIPGRLPELRRHLLRLEQVRLGVDQVLVAPPKATGR